MPVNYRKTKKNPSSIWVPILSLSPFVGISGRRKTIFFSCALKGTCRCPINMKRIFQKRCVHNKIACPFSANQSGEWRFVLFSRFDT